MNSANFLYTVYNDRTDELIVLDGTAREAAAAMGMTLSSFYSTVTRTRKGIRKKWAIETIKRREQRNEHRPKSKDQRLR